MVVGQLAQGFDLVVNHRPALEVGVEGGGLGVHRGAPWLVDETTIHALRLRSQAIGAKTIKNGVTGPVLTPIATPQMSAISVWSPMRLSGRLMTI
jgi:hypothetical protein